MFSVIIATFDNQSTIIDSLDSICPQLTSNDELIIVNDCSQDNTYDLLVQYRAYINPEFNFRIISNPFNLGLASSLNIAIYLSTQAFIVRMDADDICFPNRLAIQKSILESDSNIDILSNSFIPFSSNSDLINVKSPDYPFNSNCTANTFKISNNALAFRNLLAHPTTIMRRHIFNDLMYDSSYLKSQDYKCWLDAICCGFVLAYSSEPVIYYRSSPDRKKYLSQLQYSIRARLSCFNFHDPCFSFFLLFGVLFDTLQVLRLITKK